MPEQKDIGVQQAEMGAAAETTNTQKPVKGQGSNLTLPTNPPILRTTGDQQAEMGNAAQVPQTKSNN